MKTYYLRLDDACEKSNVSNWMRIEKILDKFDIKPLVGIIPQCEDTSMDVYPLQDDFWETVESWVSKGWTIAMHGFNHVYETKSGGINPVQKRSEFAGLDLDLQCKKIREGISIFRSHKLEPNVFFAPSHTFDLNTIAALKKESKIRVISDTISNQRYNKYGITFVPQQSGRVRKMWLKEVTFCYHPNTMKESDFTDLELFLKKNDQYFKPFSIVSTSRRFSFLDWLVKRIYFFRRSFRTKSK